MGGLVASGPSLVQTPGRLIQTILTATLLAAVLVVAISAGRAQAQDFVELDPELDARAASLYAGIMCPQCDGQTISQSHAPIAGTMRQMVRERLLAGDTDAEIYAFMVASFPDGPSVLASPPKSGSTLIVWVVPPVALVLGVVAVVFVVRRLRGDPELAPAGPVSISTAEPESDRYLELVDREIADG